MRAQEISKFTQHQTRLLRVKHTLHPFTSEQILPLYIFLLSTSLGETMCKIKNSSLLLNQQISPWKIMEVLLYKPQLYPRLPLDPGHIWRVVELCSCQGLSSCSSHSVYELLNSRLPHHPISGEVVNSVQPCKESRFYSPVTAREFHLVNLTGNYSLCVKFTGHYKHETVVIQI